MIATLEEFLPTLALLKQEKRKLVFTNGCFDIIHAGHVTYLNQSKALGDLLIVGLNTDSSVKKIKGEGRPIICESDRAIVLDSLKAVDYVIYFSEETPFNLISTILPDVLVKGGDYKIENIVGSDIVLNNGGQVIVLPYLSGKSTTGIIDKINKL